jgi:hypothetical protein
MMNAVRGTDTFDEGNIVWEYVNPFFGEDKRWGNVNIVFRAYRYSPDFSGFRGK